MRATVPYIEQKFEEFNRQMFGRKLPKIPVELSVFSFIIINVLAKKVVRLSKPRCTKGLQPVRRLSRLTKGCHKHEDYCLILERIEAFVGF